MASETTGLSGIAGRYASALYELADEGRELDAVAVDLRVLRRLIGESDDLRRLLRSPLISRQDQAKAMEVLLEKAGTGKTVRHFVGVAAQNRRLFLLRGMIDSFLAILAARRGEVTAEITSAAPLAEGQVGALKSQLAKAVGKAVNLDFKIDPSLIGGLVVKVGSRMVDSSLKSKLQRLQLAMKGIG
ncbi:MAG TPA: F0F1 ATP synthase subunit delta [Alphaproteobacteria bacterium]|nr:F0F1 ATP synthase subunit delta [Alphaproteobacteria bacterium]